MLTLEEKRWLTKHLKDDIRAMKEDVELSGRHRDLKMAEQVIAKLSRQND